MQSKVEEDAVPSVTTTALISRSPNIVSVVHEFDPRTLRNQEVAQESQQAESQDNSEVTQKLVEETTNVSTESQDSSEKTKLTVVLPTATESEKVATELQITAESEVSNEDLVSSEAPLRPNRSKDLKIPSTPIVIGPTPPTSPPLETESSQQPKKEVQESVDSKTEETVTIPSAEVQESSPVQDITQEEQINLQPEESQEAQEEISSEKSTDPQQTEKKTKKIIKKSSAESDTPSSPESEGSSKKLGKKIVKKVKPKEGEAAEGDSGGTEKPKKTKTIKKVSKTLSSSSLEADKSVPETPPPSASSEVPVPPKRKSKSGPSTKPADKKSDES